MNHYSNFVTVFKDEIESINHVISQIEERNINNIIDAISAVKGKLIVSGIGKSGLIGKKIAATLASTGTQSFFIHSTEAFHGDLGMISNHDALLLISHSGETDDILKVLDYCNNNEILTLSISGNSKSTLAINSNFHINCNIINEACSLNLAPTSSTTATLLIGDAIAVSLMKAKSFKEIDFAKYHPGGRLGKRLLTSVSDIMRIDNMPIVNESMDLFKVIFTISDSGYGIAFCIDEDKLVGVITDGDIRRAIKTDLSFKEVKLSSLLNKDFKYAYLESNLQEIKLVMQENKIITLPVINSDSKLIGLVQYYDI